MTTPMPHGLHPWLCFSVLALMLSSAFAQLEAPECPSPWLLSNDQNRCFYFSSNIQPWSDAKLACEKFGARLISVNDNSKNDFIQTYLSKAEVDGKRNLWYTGGRVVSGPRNNPTFQWLDGTGLSSTVFWKNPQAPLTDTGDYITYIFDNTLDNLFRPAYYWVRRPGTESLRFICEIALTDAGKLISIQRGFGFGVANVHPNEIPRGPYFLSQPRDTLLDLSVDAKVTDSYDRNSVFQCDAGGVPQPAYAWYTSSNNALLNPVTNSYMTVTNGRLTIHNPVKERDIDSYYCRVTNPSGTLISEAGRINFIALAEFTKNPKPQDANQWDSTVIQCTHNNPPNIRLNFDWFLDGDRTKFISPIKNHIFNSKSGGLYFGSVTVTDIADYYCATSLVGGGTEERISPPYRLNVRTGTTFQQIGPEIHNEFPKIIPDRPVRGDTVYLECFARFTTMTGKSPEYRWRRADGRPIPADYVLTDYNRQMIIQSVDFDDEGIFVCTASYMQTSSTKNITLSISAKPFFGEGYLEDQHLDQGEKFTWNCQARGNPDPRYAWYKNGQLFNENTLPPNSGTRITFSNSYKTVTFQSVDKMKDSGMYQCAATNILGTTYSNAQLRVLEFPPNFVKHPMLGEIIASEGANATIPCDPDAAPAADLTWLKDGKPLSLVADGQSQRRKLPNGYLFISQINAGIDAGDYTCVATNKVLDQDGKPGSANATTKLLVVRRTRLSFGPIDQTVLLHSRVTLECRADYNYLLDLVYIWYHNNRLLDFEDWKMASIYERGIGVNRGDLIIKNITYEERGQYKCVGQTKSDFAQLSAIITVVGPPGEPAGLAPQNPGKHSVSLSWTKGAENGKPVFAYIIEKYNLDTQVWVFASNVSAGGDITNTTVEDLFANTGYRFRVSAQNDYGVGLPSGVSTIIQTSPDKPTSYPDNMRVGGGKEGSLLMQWDLLPKEEWNAPSVTYVAQYREYRDNTPDSQGGWLNCTRILYTYGPGTPSGRCVVTVGKTKFFTKYSVRVIAKNAMGEGPVPPSVTGMSAVAVPQNTPAGIMAQPYNSTAIMIYWDPIPDDKNVHGGELLGFHVQYWPKDTPQVYGRRNTIYGNVTEGLIIGLQPNQEYDVSAQILNSAGDGNFGRIIRQTTWKRAPQHMPEYVTLNLTGSNGIGVHWRGVVTQPDEEPLDGYKVRIWRAGENIRNAKDYDSGRRSEIILDDFVREDDQGALYNLRVFGYSRGGVGKMSSPLIQFGKGCNRQQSNPEATWVYLCDGCSHSISYALVCAVALIHLLKANL